MATKSMKIDCYVDCVSPYSYFAESYLFKNRKAFESQGVDVELHPIFLGGIMGATGNQPPGTLPVRAKYLNTDRTRAMKLFDAPNMKAPDRFPQLTLAAMRCLCYVKANYPREKWENALFECSRSVWDLNEDLGDPQNLRKPFSRAFGEGEELETILDAGKQQEWKDKLSENTKLVIGHGAYGAPWMLVTNKEGKTESFFGSDRWHYIFDFLGLQFQELKLLDISESRL